MRGHDKGVVHVSFVRQARPSDPSDAGTRPVSDLEGTGAAAGRNHPRRFGTGCPLRSSSGDRPRETPPDDVGQTGEAVADDQTSWRSGQANGGGESDKYRLNVLTRQEPWRHRRFRHRPTDHASGPQTSTSPAPRPSGSACVRCTAGRPELVSRRSRIPNLASSTLAARCTP